MCCLLNGCFYSNSRAHKLYFQHTKHILFRAVHTECQCCSLVVLLDRHFLYTEFSSLYSQSNKTKTKKPSQAHISKIQFWPKSPPMLTHCVQMWHAHWFTSECCFFSHSYHSLRIGCFAKCAKVFRFFFLHIFLFFVPLPLSVFRLASSYSSNAEIIERLTAAVFEGATIWTTFGFLFQWMCLKGVTYFSGMNELQTTNEICH